MSRGGVAGRGQCGGTTSGEEEQVSVSLRVLKKTGAWAKEELSDSAVV